MMMMSNNMENVAPHVIKNVSRQVGMTWSKTSYLEVAKVVYFWHPFKRGPFCKFGKTLDICVYGDIQVHSLVQEKMEGISIEVGNFSSIGS